MSGGVGAGVVLLVVVVLLFFLQLIEVLSVGHHEA